MKSLIHPKIISKGRLAALALLAFPALVQAGAKAPISPVVEAPEPSRFHALFKLDLSDHYITPRGLNIEDQGLIFQPLLLTFTKYDCQIFFQVVGSEFNDTLK